MRENNKKQIHIIGAGLAGSEAAWQAANMGASVILHEMRPIKKTNVHQTENFAELVCSNSFRSDDYQNNAVGLLHEEMRRLNSIIMQAADKNALPAGGALAVDREGFSGFVSDAIKNHDNITIELGEISKIPDDWENIIIATGPLTSDNLAKFIANKTSADALSFFDAIAPIIHADSINYDIVWAQSRYDKKGAHGTGADYLNCPLNEQQYNDFVDALLSGEKTEFKDWEKADLCLSPSSNSSPSPTANSAHSAKAEPQYFDGCLPIEVMAERGRETLRFGPLKPIGLTNPNNPNEKPYAIVQLRQDNRLGTLWNMVGFQTKLKHSAQVEIFRQIPGLENAKFARLGGLHRNTFINSPKLLNEQLQLKSDNRIRFAGQISGVEGYVESAAMGLVAGRLAASEIMGKNIAPPPKTTAHGSLVNHITGGHILDDNGGGVPVSCTGQAPVESEANDGDEHKKIKSFQPMNINFGLMPDIEVKKPEGVKRWRKADRKKVKKQAISTRALNDITDWLLEVES